MIKNLKNINNNGQMLVEAMVAMTVIIFGILGAIVLVSNALSLNRVVSDRLVGTYLAAEGIEIVKNLVDANARDPLKSWNQGFRDGCYDASINYNTEDIGSPAISCSIDDPADFPTGNEPLKVNRETGTYSYDSGSEKTNFYRIIKIKNIDNSEIRINSVVKWVTRGGGRFEVNLEDHFYNNH